MKTKIFSMLVCAVLYALPVLADKECPACHGSGRVVYSTGSSWFGLDEPKVKCSECGEWHYHDHHHKSCTLCKGTGRISSYTTDQEVQDHFNPEISAWARYNAQTQLYGIPLRQDELDAIKRFYIQDSKACSNFQRWIDMANCVNIYFMGAYKRQAFLHDTPNNVNTYWSKSVEALNNQVSTYYLPNSQLMDIFNRVWNTLEGSYKLYIAQVNASYDIRMRQKQLEDAMLQRYSNTMW